MSLQKYSVVFENETQRRDRSGRRWVGWTGLRAGRRRGGLRSGSLTRVEKAGLLGMVAVVVIILGVIVTSDDRGEEMLLNPSSDASKVQNLLKQGQGIDHTTKVQRPSDPLNREVIAGVFADRDEKIGTAPLDLRDGMRKPRAGRLAKPAKMKPKVRIYKVRDGDTLGHIAKRMLGKAWRWTEIKALNPKINVTNLKVGDKIKIPPR